MNGGCKGGCDEKKAIKYRKKNKRKKSRLLMKILIILVNRIDHGIYEMLRQSIDEKFYVHQNCL